MIVPVGSRIKFRKEKQRYTVQASDERYSICTKPMNAHKTVLYTIIDHLEQERGTDNLVFGFGYETQEQCEDNLKALQDGEMNISRRNKIPLDIERIEGYDIAKR